MAKSHYLGDGTVGEGIHIARGAMAETSHINKFGYNTSVGTNWEIISDLGGDQYYPTSAGVVSIVSADANDDDGDTGARTVEIQGLDGNYNHLSETVTMNGTSAVTTSGTFHRIFRAKVLTAGSSGINEGVITLSIGGNNIARISADNGGQTLMATYTVPNGCKGYILQFQGSMSKNQEAQFMIRTRNGEANSAWQVKGMFGTFANSVGYIYPVPLEVDEKTDIEIRGKAGATSELGAIFDIVLVDQ